MYYRLDVAIDAVAMWSAAVRRTAPAPLPESDAPVSAEERDALEDAPLSSSPADPADAPLEIPVADGDGAAASEDAPTDAPEKKWLPLDRPRILDLSGSGMQLQARNTEVTTGDHVVVAFPFGGNSYRLATEVMWARRSQFGAATRLGLRFEGMDERQREGLVREIYRAQRSAGKLRRR